MQYIQFLVGLAGLTSIASTLAIPKAENAVSIRAEEGYTGPGGE